MGRKEAAAAGESRSRTGTGETPLAVIRRGRSRVGRSAAQTVIADAAGGAKKAGNLRADSAGQSQGGGVNPRSHYLLPTFQDLRQKLTP